jgi:hypothetical protein
VIRTNLAALLRARRKLIQRGGGARRARSRQVARTITRSIPSRYVSQGRVLRGSLKRRLAAKAGGLLDARMGMPGYAKMIRRAQKRALY